MPRIIPGVIYYNITVYKNFSALFPTATMNEYVSLTESAETTNAIIEAEVIVDSTRVTINFNSSLSTITSGTYRVVVIG